MNQENSTQLKCICEHNWHKCMSNNLINASELLSIVQDKMDNQPVKTEVDEWIDSFNARSGSHPLNGRLYMKNRGGRVVLC